MLTKLSIAGVFFLSMFFFPFSQSAKPLSAENVAYVTQAGQRLVMLEKFYETNNALVNISATITDVIQAQSVLTNTIEVMNKQTPPADLLAYHSQFLFAAWRCDNLAIGLRNFSKNKNPSPYDIASFYIQKENCVNQIQAVRLRLIDYASVHSIDVSQYVRFPVATFVYLAKAAAPSSPTVEATTPIDPSLSKDDLGIPYEFVNLDPGIKVSGWEAYENHDGYWSVAGTIQNIHSTDRFSIVDFKIRFYKGQRLVQVSGNSASGRWVDPGQSLPFEFSFPLKPSDFDRYTVEATAGDWGKAP